MLPRHTQENGISLFRKGNGKGVTRGFPGFYWTTAISHTSTERDQIKCLGVGSTFAVVSGLH
jgi:hypothetical protein